MKNADLSKKDGATMIIIMTSNNTPETKTEP